jgi:hypothetical protein
LDGDWELKGFYTKKVRRKFHEPGVLGAWPPCDNYSIKVRRKQEYIVQTEKYLFRTSGILHFAIDQGRHRGCGLKLMELSYIYKGGM